jgi:hypothetical protein
MVLFLGAICGLRITVEMSYGLDQNDELPCVSLQDLISMKRLILAATVINASLLPFTCSANADSLGINKDCDNHPVSQYGMNSIKPLP